MTFAIGGMAFWMPDYLERHQRSALFGMPPRTGDSADSSPSPACWRRCPAAGSADRLRGRFRGSYFLVSGAAMAVGFPMVLGFLYTPFPRLDLCLPGCLLPVLQHGADEHHPRQRDASLGPLERSAAEHPRHHLFGDAVSPALMELCDGRLFPDAGFHLVAWTILIGGILWHRNPAPAFRSAITAGCTRIAYACSATRLRLRGKQSLRRPDRDDARAAAGLLLPLRPGSSDPLRADTGHAAELPASRHGHTSSGRPGWLLHRGRRAQ